MPDHLGSIRFDVQSCWKRYYIINPQTTAREKPLCGSRLAKATKESLVKPPANRLAATENLNPFLCEISPIQHGHDGPAACNATKHLHPCSMHLTCKLQVPGTARFSLYADKSGPESTFRMFNTRPPQRLDTCHAILTQGSKAKQYRFTVHSYAVKPHERKGGKHEKTM